MVMVIVIVMLLTTSISKTLMDWKGQTVAGCMQFSLLITRMQEPNATTSLTWLYSFQPVQRLSRDCLYSLTLSLHVPREYMFLWWANMNLDWLSESLLLVMYCFAGELHTLFQESCVVLSLAILSKWCSGEVSWSRHQNHPGHLTYFIVYHMFSASELSSSFCMTLCVSTDL